MLISMASPPAQPPTGRVAAMAPDAQRTAEKTKVRRKYMVMRGVARL